ncbi:hypothetical protein DY000_02002378 [Brassica cretica]|uniref:ENTH domain-containing protein n=1 Tax=Brassica cretica TaxID=69181 RepID=A0ABQ7BVS2_BRACR|nr:hypothetical protein DY000_02002378 [Brassica cretica]
MKKVFGQTVRDLKREVNKKVLKVPGIEQKVLDATSNEPWGPHGSLLADIAQASRNYHEYQMIMGVIWKRLSDTGKNWRHVFKALTVLEYMVGHGSERVIEEIRERAYQISTLSDFQYIDSGGRDQGTNVRKKSQSLVALVNDKERIAEVREKASANRDKYRSSAPGGMYKPSGGYGDKYDYGSRDEERCSYGREREYGYRDDDRNSRDGDRHSRDSEDRYGRDGNREDDYRGRSRSVDNYQNGSRGRSSERERTFEDDGHSSRGSGARADDSSQDGRGQLQRKFSEQNIGAPPSYEEAVSDSRSPVYSERDGGETPQAAAPEAGSPPPQAVAPGAGSPPPPQAVAPGAASPSAPQIAAPTVASPPAGNNTDNKSTGFDNESSPQNFEAFDEFDPRGAFSACPPAYASADGVSAPPTMASTSAPPTSNSVEMDLLGSLADVFSPNPLAIVPAESTSVETNGQANAPSFSTSQPSAQTFDDPFGESPFKAFTSTDSDSNPQQSFGAPFQPTPPAFTSEVTHPDTARNFGFGDSFSTVANPEPGVQNMQPPSNSPGFLQEQFDTSDNDFDILAGILPPSGPQVSVPQQSSASVPTSQFPPSGNNMYEGNHPQPVSTAPNMPGQTPFGQAVQPYNMVPHSQNTTGATPFHNGGFMHQPGSAVYNPGVVTSHPTSESFHPRPVAATSSSSQTPYSTPSGPAARNFGFGDSFSTVANPEPGVQNMQPPSNSPGFLQEQFDTSDNDFDILAGILPPSGPQVSVPQQSSASVPTSQFPPSGNNMYEGYHPQPVSTAPNMPGQTPFGQAVQPYNMVPHSQNTTGATPFHNGGFMHQPGSAVYNPGVVTSHPTSESFHPRPVAATSSSSQTPYSTPSGPAGQFMTHQGHEMSPSHAPQRTQSGPVTSQRNNNFMGDMFTQAGPTSAVTSSSSSHSDLTPITGAIEIVPPPQKKFEPKSSVWADTLSRGLVNFNISGPKTNPLADIGVDFEAINRREKRLEKPTNTPPATSTINMGKAMGSGTGLGRAGATAMRPPPNPMVGSGMPMGGGGYGGMNQNQHMGMGMGPGMNPNQPMGMGMGPGMKQTQPMGMGMGPGMNMGGGYGQGYPMQPQNQGMVPGPNMPGNNNYNPMMGQGGYNPQQSYGGGYR